jgi:hypothetical protein
MTTGRKDTIAGAFDNLRRVVQVVHGYSKRAEHAAGLTGPQLWAIKVLMDMRWRKDKTLGVTGSPR